MQAYKQVEDICQKGPATLVEEGKKDLLIDDRKELLLFITPHVLDDLNNEST